MQAVDVIKHDPGLKAVGLAAGRNWRKALEQARSLGATKVALWDVQAAAEAERSKGYLGLENLEVLSGQEGVERLAALSSAHTVLHAVPGFLGVKLLLRSLEGGKRVALAGKEALVCAGELVRDYVQKGNLILPVDSEHSAIFQCIQGESLNEVDYITLTASGGAFRDLSKDELSRVVPSQALAHPTWRMGPKVTVDSATLFNKALEVMEAHCLFGLPYDKIRVVIHRESIVHSMVTFKDGSTKAQLAPPDMRLPIAYALNYPKRKPGVFGNTGFFTGTLAFEQPDLERFPCLGLGYEAGRMGGTAPCVLSVADEIVVEAFLSGEVKFTEIYTILKAVLDSCLPKPVTSVDVLEQEARWAAWETRRLINTLTRR
ncbi:MAG: 1-deoxy-D-xylulose-5-phosphate reductoisomerase [Bacillota bacterium]|jgi:1-deoxy-D-xylulose-5-phosphate reductoisomerase